VAPWRVALFLVLCVDWYSAVGLASLRPAVNVAAFVLTVVFVRWDRLRLSDVGAAISRGSVGRLGAGFAVGMLLLVLHSAISRAVTPIHWVRSEKASLSTGAIWLGVFLFFAAREELAFRGYPLRRLATRWGPWPAQIAIALVFGAEHLGGGSWVNAMIGAGAGSFLFGMAALASGGLALPIGIHAAWNFGDWLRGGKGAGSPWTVVVEDGQLARTDATAMVVYVVLVALATAALAWWGRRRRLPLASAHH
jgi:membrane protease YdiL (CAAX protease family)